MQQNLKVRHMRRMTSINQCYYSYNKIDQAVYISVVTTHLSTNSTQNISYYTGDVYQYMMLNMYSK